jgi:stage II sporulation protein AB (anti-sigma F factor)
VAGTPGRRALTPRAAPISGRARWEIESDTARIAPLRRHAIAFAAELGVPAQGLDDLALAVSEALGNAIVHGYGDRREGTVHLEINAGADAVLVRVRDFGAGIARAGALETEGRCGYGLHLIGAITESFELRSWPGEGTEVSMWFRAA